MSDCDIILNYKGHRQLMLEFCFMQKACCNRKGHIPLTDHMKWRRIH